MKTHELKSWPDYFRPLLDGSKPFDVRINDRHFQAGDALLIREWDDKRAAYTGRQLRKRVTYVLEGIGAGSIAPLVGVQRGYCVLGLGDPLP